MSRSAVVFAEAGAAEPVGMFTSQGNIKIAMEICMAEIEGIMKDEKVQMLQHFQVKQQHNRGLCWKLRSWTRKSKKTGASRT